MLADDDILYFLHIHKTAGTTLRQLLELHFSHAEICPARVWDELKDRSPEDLAGYRFFRGHFLCFRHLLRRKPTIITMLRDPVERSISAYHFIRVNPDHALYHLARRLTLPQYLEDERTVETIRDYQTRWILSNVFRCDSLKQLDRRLQRKGVEPLEEARRQLEKFAFVGLVERFDDSVSMLFDAMGWSQHGGRRVVKSQKLNTTRGRARQESLPRPTIDRIRELTRMDRQLYAWATELFEKRWREAASRPAAPASPGRLSSVRLELADAVPGIGWHAPEVDPRDGAGFRWTGPAPEASLFVPLESDRDLDLRFSVHDAVDRRVLRSLEVHVNEAPVRVARESTNGNRFIYRGTVPASLLEESRDVTCLSFRVKRTARRRRWLRLVDGRRLGIALNWIELSPAGGAPAAGPAPGAGP